MPCSLKPFVSNRVAMIQELLPNTQWRHVSNHNNPADLLSRGISACKLIASDLWWHGPLWLCQPKASWSSSGVGSLPRCLPEIKTVLLTAIMEPVVPWTLWTRYSSFTTLTRTLESSEITSTRNFIIRHAQLDNYADVFECVKRKQNLPKQHPLEVYELTTIHFKRL